MSRASAALGLRVEALSRACQEILHGEDEAIQGAVLADLLSLWVAGHLDLGELGKDHRPVTELVRKALLDDFIETVLKLVPESEREIMARIKPEGRA